ncbi:hypothetical protein CEK25_011301 [Fusarium fujikuroi]|nr:hypothetical protein CEK25_011301 [Fusarium fujikuroi]
MLAIWTQTRRSSNEYRRLTDMPSASKVNAQMPLSLKISQPSGSTNTHSKARELVNSPDSKISPFLETNSAKNAIADVDLQAFADSMARQIKETSAWNTSNSQQAFTKPSVQVGQGQGVGSSSNNSCC